MIRSLFNSALVLVLGTCLLLVACGKETKTAESGLPVSERSPQTAIDAYIERQDVSCEPNQACPSYITKIVVVDKDKYRFCTGFLIDSDVVATSTTCLPALLRGVGQDCSNDVFFFFPFSGNRPAERVGCSKVLQTSNLDGNDPSFWRDDVSILKLDRPMVNRSANYVRDGVQNNKEYYSFMVDQQSDYSAIIKRVYCTATHNSYVNPLASTPSSPNLLFANCALTNGGTGAPILDASGKIRAIASKSISDSLKASLHDLLFEGLKEMFHATNLACAPLLSDTRMLDDKECLKDLTLFRMGNLRTEMMATKSLFAEASRKLQESVNRISKFVIYKVQSTVEGDIQTNEVLPDCFMPLKGWLPYYSSRTTSLREMILIPERTFKRALNSVGRPQAYVIDKGANQFKIQISLKSLRNTGYSTVLLTKPDDTVLNESPFLSEKCSLL